MKYSLVISLFIFSSLTGQLSAQRINISELHIQQIVTKLNPLFLGNDTVKIYSFLVSPLVKPNSSLRIIKVNEQNIMEIRCLDKNILDELYASYREKRYPQVSIKTQFYSIPVSNHFVKKVLEAFFNVKELRGDNVKLYDNGILLTHRFNLFDGSNYEFLAYMNGKVENTSIQVSEKDPYNADPVDSTDYIYKVKLTNIRIINDVKNGTFNESKYEIYK